MAIYILGHKKPDLDSIASAVALAKFKKVKAGSEFIAGRVDKINPETDYILKKFKVNPPKLISASGIKPRDRVILVDHNEESQRLDDLNPEQIIEIIDHHHRISLEFNQPIKVTILPWGATSTIVFSLFEQERITPSPTTAQLMLSAILSDTVGLKSPTTQEVDKETVTKLQRIAGINDLEDFVFELLKAKSDISGLTPTQIVTNDYKIYDFSGLKVFIGQVETVEQEKVLHKKNQFLSAMKQVKAKEGLDLIFLALTDVSKENTKMLYLTRPGKETLERAFGRRGRENIIDIGPCLSRKKQMAPKIERVIKLPSGGG